MGEEVKNWFQVSFDVGSKHFWAHAKDSWQILLENAFGLEKGDYVLNGIKGSRVKGRVEGKCFA